MKYLFIGAHPDDVELCCGGTMTKLIDNGHEVHVLTLSHFFYGVDLKGEWLDSMVELRPDGCNICTFDPRLFSSDRQEILDLLLTYSNKFDYIFTHSASDYHQDHRTVGEESIRAFKGHNLITYKGVWNGDEKSNYFVHLKEKHIKAKLSYLECYKSQSNRTYTNSDAIYAMAINAGLKCKTKYAESFEIVCLNQ